MKKLFLISTLFLLNAVSLYGYQEYCTFSVTRRGGKCPKPSGKPVTSATFSYREEVEGCVKKCYVKLNKDEITFFDEIMKKTKEKGAPGLIALKELASKEYKKEVAPIEKEYKKKVAPIEKELASIKDEYKKKLGPINAKNKLVGILLYPRMRRFSGIRTIEQLRSAIDKASTSK